MNNTKWTEIFKLFYYGVECSPNPIPIRWTTRSINGYLYSDSTWTHFGVGTEHSTEIDWLRIDLTPENREIVLEILRKVHVPGEILGDQVYIYGHRMDVDYL